MKMETRCPGQPQTLVVYRSLFTLLNLPNPSNETKRTSQITSPKSHPRVFFDRPPTGGVCFFVEGMGQNTSFLLGFSPFSLNCSHLCLGLLKISVVILLWPVSQNCTVSDRPMECTVSDGFVETCNIWSKGFLLDPSSILTPSPYFTCRLQSGLSVYHLREV